MGFDEAIGAAKRVDYATEVERVRNVAAEAEAVEKTECFVDVPVFGAEGVNLFGPVRPVGYAHLLFLFNWVIDFVYWVSLWLFFGWMRNSVCEEESNRNGYGYGFVSV